MLITFGEMRVRGCIVIFAMRASGWRHKNGFDQRQNRSVVAHGVRNIAWFRKRRDCEERNANAILIKVGARCRKWSGGIKSELRAQISGVVRRSVCGAQQIE